MKKAVHFGAGKIGRGFIAELLHDSGYEIVFADVVDALIEQVNGGYSLFLTTSSKKSPTSKVGG